MRAGGCTLQQGLTVEAASVVKQAVNLARRRGHAQVTPLHVASTMLSATAGILRTACLQSHSHPLQCRALELCFNVALNRLPASNSSPMLGGAHHSHHAQHPSISNALIAAFKRAQAHQRRGSIESQQQPLLAVKIELEQLIISILDDPSVSRVMREAGFSSTHVKSNVEQAVSLEICSQTSNSTNNNKSKESGGGNNSLLVLSHHDQQYHQPSRNGSKTGEPISVSLDPEVMRRSDEDVMSVMECLVSKKKRSVVVVGECICDIEGVVRGVMEKVEKGLDIVPEGLREVKFIPFQLSSFGMINFSRVDVEQKIGELKSLLRTCVAKGVILYLGDLKWATSGSSDHNQQQGNIRGYYCPVEHMIMEIGKLVCEIGENNGRFWLMGIATFQTYMKCKSGHPSLEAIWGIHPLTIPAGSLRLSLLTTESDLRSDESTSKNIGTSNKILVVENNNNNNNRDHNIIKHDKLTCCAECSAKFHAEARNLPTNNTNSDSTTSNLPAWLQQCRNETKELRSSNHDQNCVTVTDLYKKWNSYCSSTHHQQRQPNNYFSEKTINITFSSVSPSSSSASGFSYDHHHSYLHQNPNPSFHQNKSFWESQSPNRISTSSTINEPSLRLYFPENKENNPSKQPIALFSSSNNPNSNPNSASSSEAMEAEYSHKFKELNSENLNTLISALERRVPWQKEIIPEIASTVLKCRSGTAMRRSGELDRVKEETWLLFQGVDSQAKEKIARELARLVFGSRDEFVSIALSSFSSTRADSTEDFGGNNGNKRLRDEQSCSYVERFGEAVSFNPHRVFLVEDVEQADYCSQMGFKRAIERGRIRNSNGEEVELSDAIVILSCESFSSRSRACSPPVKHKIMDDHNQSDHQLKADHDHHDVTISPCLSLDLNISFDDDGDEEDGHDQSIDDIGLLESVDRRIVFKIQEL